MSGFACPTGRRAACGQGLERTALSPLPAPEVDEKRRKGDGMKAVSPEDGGETEAGTQRNSHKSGECSLPIGAKPGPSLQGFS